MLPKPATKEVADDGTSSFDPIAPSSQSQPVVSTLNGTADNTTPTKSREMSNKKRLDAGKISMKQPKITSMFATSSQNSASQCSEDSNQPSQTLNDSQNSAKEKDEDPSTSRMSIRVRPHFSLDMDRLIQDLNQGNMIKEVRAIRKQQMDSRNDNIANEAVEMDQMLDENLSSASCINDVSDEPSGLEIFHEHQCWSVFRYPPSATEMNSKLGKKICLEDELRLLQDFNWLQRRCRNSKSEGLLTYVKTLLLEIIVCHHNESVAGLAFKILSDMIGKRQKKKSTSWNVPIADWIAYFINVGAELKDICPHEDLLPCDIEAIKWRFNVDDCSKSSLLGSSLQSYDIILRNKVKYLVACLFYYLEQLPVGSQAVLDRGDITTLVVILLRITLDSNLLYDIPRELSITLSTLILLIPVQQWPQAICDLARRISTIGENLPNLLHILDQLWLIECARCLQLRRLVCLVALHQELGCSITDEELQNSSQLSTLLRLFEKFSLRTIPSYKRLYSVVELVNIIVVPTVTYQDKDNLKKLIGLFHKLDSSIREGRDDKNITILKFSLVQKGTQWRMIHSKSTQTTMENFFPIIHVDNNSL